MTRAEKASIAYQLVAHGPRVMGGDAVLSDEDFKFWNINYDFVAGYEQAEKDLSLTIDDIKKIDELLATHILDDIGDEGASLDDFYTIVLKEYKEWRNEQH